MTAGDSDCDGSAGLVRGLHHKESACKEDHQDGVASVAPPVEPHPRVDGLTCTAFVPRSDTKAATLDARRQSGCAGACRMGRGAC